MDQICVEEWSLSEQLYTLTLLNLLIVTYDKKQTSFVESVLK